MSSPSAESRPEAPPRDFIREIVAQDVESGKHGGEIVTRFPPEPNGRLHIGHAKAICIDFGVAQEFGGRCNLRFDDTNPVKESQEYVDEIERDIRWLGFDWGAHLYHASDYFEQLYQWAEQLVRDGKAYVDSLTADEMREYRGTLTEPGRDSPYRNRDRSTKISICSAACAPASSRTARTCCARRSTWRRATSTCAIRSCTASARRTHQRTGDTWVHLSDVRLGARTVRLHRRGHLLALLARVRGSSAAVRLVPRRARTSSAASAADRVRAPEPELHGDEQAHAARAGRGRARRAAGTIRACRRFPGCDGAATRPSRSAISASASASRSATTSSTSRTSSTRSAKT